MTAGATEKEMGELATRARFKEIRTERGSEPDGRDRGTQLWESDADVARPASEGSVMIPRYKLYRSTIKGRE
jgi:hypothetical protein